MDVLAARVNWVENFDNTPRFEVLLSREPKPPVFQQKDYLYWGEDNGFVEFFYYHSPGKGYGGSKFTINVNGQTKTLIGPWSSRAGIMNKYFPHCMEVSWVSDKASYDRGYTFIVGAITLELAKKAAKLAGVHLVKITNNLGETTYYPSLLPNILAKPRLRKDGMKIKYWVAGNSYEY